MMQQHVLLPHHVEDVRVRRQRRIARRLEDAVLEIRKRVVRHERREVRHRERTVDAVEIRLAEIEIGEELLAEIARAICFHFEANGVAAARPSQLLLDAAEEIIRFFFVDVEIAVSRHAKGVHAIEDQAGKQVGDVVFNQRRQVDVFPRLVIAFAPRHLDQSRQHPRHLHDRVERLASLLGPRADEQVVALVQQLRERMTRVDRERREHRENFLLEKTSRPGRALRVQLRDFVDADAVLREQRHQFVTPERVLSRDHLVRGSLDRVEGVGRRQSIRSDVTRFALDLLLDAGDADLEKLIEIRADDGEELDPLDQRLRRVLRFLEDAAVELEPAQLAIDEILRAPRSGTAGALPRPPASRRCSSARRISVTVEILKALTRSGLLGCRGSCQLPIAGTREANSFPYRSHLAEARLIAEHAAEDAALFLFRTDRGRRPAFDDLEREEAEEREARELQVEPQVLRDLCDGAGAVELRGELRLRNRQPQALHALEAVARVGGNRRRIVVRLIAELRELNKAQRAERPVIDVFFARNVLRVIGEIVGSART